MEPCVVILPAQAIVIADMAYGTGSAVSVTQNGSVLILNTGEGTFAIDAKGRHTRPPEQENLFAEKDN